MHSNTIENVFSVFKRGMYGAYRHCGEAHRHATLPNSISATTAAPPFGIGDRERSEVILRGAVGKRLTYRRLGEPRLA